MNRIICGLLLPLAFTSCASAQQTPVDYESLRAQADHHFRNEEAAETVTRYRALTEWFPEDAEVWYRLSRGQEWSGELQAAIEAGERVQQLGWIDPDSTAYRLARLNARAGNPGQALDWLARSLTLRFGNRPGIANDPAFESLRNVPEFRELAGLLPDENMSREQGLNHDLDYLIEEAQRMHAGPDRPAYSSAFLDAARALRQTLPEASDLEFYTGIMQLLAILDDGHSGIYSADPDSPLAISASTLPLKFYNFEEGLFVVDGIGEAARFAGMEVTQFGSLTATETLNRLATLRGGDNAMTWQWMGPQFHLPQLALLQWIGATASAEAVDLTLGDRTGETRSVTVRGGNYPIVRKLRPSPAATGDVPMYLQRVDTNYWLESLPDYRALYFQFNQVRDAEGESLIDFAARLAQRLDEESAESLIIDMRHNNGGNNTLVAPLVQKIIAFEQASPDHQVHVITGRNTFSAAQNFINRIERWTDAVFVGEPSASSPNFTGEETVLLLPYSRIRGSISNRYWQDSNPGDERPWIVPAIPVPVTAADYFSGRDAALEAVLQGLL